jgi:Flp pilus assembly protein TadD
MTSDPGLGRIDEVISVADAYIDAGKYESAREVLSRSLTHHPNDPSLLAHHARAELALGNYWHAARSAHAALSGAPEDEFAMRMYALSLYNLERHHDALWLAFRTVKAHPNKPEPLRLYALLLQKMWQLRSALVVVDQALRLDPQSVVAHIRRGSILYDLKRGEESDASYRAALQLDPANAEALNDLAVHRLERNKLGRALRGFLGAAGSDPAYGKLARRNIGVVLRKVFTGVTIGAGLLGVLLGFAAGAYGEGHSTVALRVVVGLLTAALIAVLRWSLRAIPRQILISVLRDQHFVTLRIAHAVIAVAAGAWVTIVPRPEAMVAVGGLLAVSALVIIRIGLIIGK